MTETATRILIVEDDEDIAFALARGLKREGYMPMIANDVSGAEDMIRDGCNAAIVDMMLGQDRGEDLVRQWRKDGLDIPIIVLSALSTVDDRMRGLAAGADDYVAKPFEFAELLTRLQVQESRRADSQLPAIEIDPERRQIARGQNAATLTQREYDLLAYLLDHEEQVLSRGEIFDALWLREGGSAENVVDVYLGYLRRKLSPAARFGIEIKTVRGKGFVLSQIGGT